MEPLMAQQLRILLADDNAAILKFVTRILERRFNIVGAFDRGILVLQNASTLRPDIIVLDIAMGEMNGFDVARELRAVKCPSKIIFLTVHQEFEFVQAAFDAGASGYVYKSRLSTDLIAAINAVENGRVFLPNRKEPHTTGAGAT